MSYWLFIFCVRYRKGNSKTARCQQFSRLTASYMTGSLPVNWRTRRQLSDRPAAGYLLGSSPVTCQVRRHLSAKLVAGQTGGFWTSMWQAESSSMKLVVSHRGGFLQSGVTRRSCSERLSIAHAHAATICADHGLLTSGEPSGFDCSSSLANTEEAASK